MIKRNVRKILREILSKGVAFEQRLENETNQACEKAGRDHLQGCQPQTSWGRRTLVKNSVGPGDQEANGKARRVKDWVTEVDDVMWKKHKAKKSMLSSTPLWRFYMHIKNKLKGSMGKLKKEWCMYFFFLKIGVNIFIILFTQKLRCPCLSTQKILYLHGMK